MTNIAKLVAPKLPDLERWPPARERLRAYRPADGHATSMVSIQRQRREIWMLERVVFAADHIACGQAYRMESLYCGGAR
jgi:hypothetical protein